MDGKGKTGAHTEGVYKVGLPYRINGTTYRPAVDYRYSEFGIASWYGRDFHGKRTANGGVYNMYEVSAAHRTLPLPSVVRVTNLENGRSLVVRVTDRGPFAKGRIIDLSRKAADILGFRLKGTARVKVEIMANQSRALAQQAKREGRVGEDPVTVASIGRAVARAPDTDMASAPWRNPDAVGQPTGSRSRVARADTAVTVENLPPLEGGSQSGRARPAAKAISKPSQVVAVYQPDDSKMLFVQAGAFRSYDNAAKLREKLGAVAPAAINLLNRGKERLYRVRLGPLSSISEADRVLESLMSKGHGNATIVVEELRR